ncbi:hypothetical protein [Paenibacillus polymyxa]|uniref:hypothetical protein n=1 Tax=Paenibacillus polymyxa TaxID=1406 RepID=UPI0023F67898|nr:hypothetical protein [Paenibacillus polymyxa]
MNTTIMNIVIFFSILLLILAFIDWSKFSKYLDKVSELTKSKKRCEIKFDRESTNDLYQLYDRLPPHLMKIKKLSLQTEQKTENIFEKSIDLFHKLFLTVMFTFIAFTGTISATMINFLNGRHQDYNNDEWVSNVQKFIDMFGSGLNFFGFLALISLYVCLFTINHLFIVSLKKKIINHHLSIINEIEKERS